MKRRSFNWIAAALACAAFVPDAAASPRARQRRAVAPRLQTEFDMESPIKRRVKVPRYVVEQMGRAERAERAGVPADFANGAEGALMNLNDDGRDDLLVRADPGANITGFWLFRNTGRRRELVLYTVAASLSVKKTRTNGFHDVEVVAASAVKGWQAFYKFDGAKYKPGGCWERDLGVGKDGEWGKPRRIPCSGGDVKPYR